MTDAPFAPLDLIYAIRADLEPLPDEDWAWPEKVATVAAQAAIRWQALNTNNHPRITDDPKEHAYLTALTAYAAARGHTARRAWALAVAAAMVPVDTGRLYRQPTPLEAMEWIDTQGATE